MNPVRIDVVARVAVHQRFRLGKAVRNRKVLLGLTSAG